MNQEVYVGVDTDLNTFVCSSFVDCLDYLEGSAGGHLNYTDVTDYEGLSGSGKLARRWTVSWQDSTGQDFDVYIERKNIWKPGGRI